MNTQKNAFLSKGKSGQMFSALLVLFAYVALAFILFGFHGSWTKFYCGEGGDPIAFIWGLNWWPFAITHDLNPFISHYLWFPNGFNLTWRSWVPFLSLLGLPVTLISWPVLTFNLLTITHSDAVMPIDTDLQDPPELIAK